MSTPLPPSRWYHVGPHAYYDLVRLARRGRTAMVRVGYVLALFAALAVVYYAETTTHRRFRNGLLVEDGVNQNARIAERFSLTILVMQNLAVCVLTPIYIAASLQEERDKHTLPILFTTQLTARMIVLGKWASCVVQVGSVIMAGLPILAFAQLWGGIDMQMIAANFWNTGMMLLSVAALSMSVAVQYPGIFRAVAVSYLLTGTLSATCFCCLVPAGSFAGQSVFLITPYGSEEFGYAQMLILASALAFAHSALAAFLLARAARNLDRQRGDDPPPVDVGPLPGIDRRRNRWWRFPPVPEDVVAWKERYLDASPWMVTPLAFFPFVLFWLWFFVMVLTSAGPQTRAGTALMEDFYPFFVFIMLGTGGMYIVLVAFRLAGCLVRERQQRTLEALLVLPMSQREFLLSKLKGNLLRFWTWLLPFGVTWLFLLIFGFPDRLRGCALLLALPIHLAFFAMLGLFLSVICRTAVSAYMSLGVVLFVVVVGTAFARVFMLRDWDPALYLVLGVNPVGCWCTFCAPDPDFDGMTRLQLSTALAFYIFGVVVLWAVTLWRFRRNPTGST